MGCTKRPRWNRSMVCQRRLWSGKLHQTHCYLIKKISHDISRTYFPKLTYHGLPWDGRFRMCEKAKRHYKPNRFNKKINGPVAGFKVDWRTLFGWPPKNTWPSFILLSKIRNIKSALEYFLLDPCSFMSYSHALRSNRIKAISLIDDFFSRCLSKSLSIVPHTSTQERVPR